VGRLSVCLSVCLSYASGNFCVAPSWTLMMASGMWAPPSPQGQPERRMGEELSYQPAISIVLSTVCSVSWRHLSLGHLDSHLGKCKINEGQNGKNSTWKTHSRAKTCAIWDHSVLPATRRGSCLNPS